MTTNIELIEISKSVSYPTDYDDGKTDLLYQDIIEEEEDNDGNSLKKIKENLKISNSEAFSTIIKAIIGFGIVNLAYVFKILGIIPCLGIMILICLINYSSISSLLECKNITRKYGYSMYAKITFGTAGSIFIKFMIMAESFGCCCAHLKIFGETILSIIKLFFNFNYTILQSEKFYSFLVFIFLCPFVIKKEISALKNVAFIGVIFIIVFLITIIALFIYKVIKGSIPPLTSLLLFPNKMQPIEMFTSFTALLEAFSYQSIGFSVYISLAQRNNKTMKRLTSNSLLFSFVIYIITGILCVIMYSDSTSESIITNFREDIMLYKSKSYFPTIILVIGQVALLVSSCFNFPLTFFALKKNFINLYIMIMKKFSKDINQSKTKPLTDYDAKTDEPNSISSTLRIIINLLLYCLILLIVITTDQVITICNFVGSTCSNVIIVLAPHVFVIMLFKTPLCSFKRFKEKMIFLLGIFTLIGFLYVKIGNLILQLVG